MEEGVKHLGAALIAHVQTEKRVQPWEGALYNLSKIFHENDTVHSVTIW